jgi:hypothetical protein
MNAEQLRQELFSTQVAQSHSSKLRDVQAVMDHNHKSLMLSQVAYGLDEVASNCVYQDDMTQWRRTTISQFRFDALEGSLEGRERLRWQQFLQRLTTEGFNIRQITDGVNLLKRARLPLAHSSAEAQSKVSKTDLMTWAVEQLDKRDVPRAKAVIELLCIYNGDAHPLAAAVAAEQSANA